MFQITQEPEAGEKVLGSCNGVGRRSLNTSESLGNCSATLVGNWWRLLMKFKFPANMAELVRRGKKISWYLRVRECNSSLSKPVGIIL